MLEKLNTVTQKFMKTQKQPFQSTRRERFLQQNSIKGITGSTWDATHMTSFLNKSFYSNKKSSLHEDNRAIRRDYSVRRKKSGDFFFKNLRYDANTSHIGYSSINPLVSNSQTFQQRQKVLADFFIKHQEKINEAKRDKSPVLRCNQKAKFNYQANKVKFRATNPLTSQYEIDTQQKPGYRIQRMKKQIYSRYPHGMTGIESPHQSSSIFYEHSEEKSNRIRQSPMSKTSFEIDRDWKSKRRVPPIPQSLSNFRQTQCMRKSRNQNSHGYDIISNRIVYS